MLLWIGILLIVIGGGCFAVDRQAVDFFYYKIGRKLHRFLFRTTHMAKAAHWLAFSVAVWLASGAYLYFIGEASIARQAFDTATAFICALALGSAVLHTIKLILCRRRPRDLIEMNLYGFVPFSFDVSRNSFPSGHSLTIMIVAVSLSALWPFLAPLWFVAAVWLSLTRAMVNAHFLSDVAIGAGFGLISAHIVYGYVFPSLALSWF